MMSRLSQAEPRKPFTKKITAIEKRTFRNIRNHDTTVINWVLVIHYYNVLNNGQLPTIQAILSVSLRG